MATYKGSAGIVKVGANTVAEVTSFSVEVSGDTIEDTELTDTWRSHLANKQGWTASIECHFDPTDSTGQGALDVGSEVTLNLYPAGESASPAPAVLSGSYIITGKTISNSDGSTVTASISGTGNGALTGI